MRGRGGGKGPRRAPLLALGMCVCIAAGTLYHLSKPLDKISVGPMHGGLPPIPPSAPGRTAGVDMARFPSLAEHRTKLLSQPGLGTVCVYRSGTGAAWRLALAASPPAVAVYVFDPFLNASFAAATSPRLSVAGDALQFRRAHPGVLCDVSVMDAGVVAVIDVVDAVTISACVNTLVARFDVPAAGAGTRAYRPPSWQRLLALGLVVESYCETAASPAGAVAMDCVGQIIVRTLACARSHPSPANAALQEVIATNARQKVWATDADFAYRWSMGVYGGEHPVLDSTSLANGPVLLAEDVWDQPSDFVADPLLIWVPDDAQVPGALTAADYPPPVGVEGWFVPRTPAGEHAVGTWYMFYETLSTLSWNGDIGWAYSRDGLRWRHGGIAIDEPFHLSFPFPFTVDGEYFLMPETHANDTVALYRAVAFPHTWALVKLYFTRTGSRFGATMVDHISLHVPREEASDGSDTVYMWSYLAGTDKFMLFYMDRSVWPYGEWTVHPLAPISALVATGQAYTDTSSPPWTPRSNGRIAAVAGRRYRFAQWHGESVYAWEIVTLSRTEYGEVPARGGAAKGAVVGPSGVVEPGLGWRAGGMHTYDAHPLDAQGSDWLVAVDGRKDARSHPY